MEVIAFEGLPITTPEGPTTLQLYEVGELLAEAVKVLATAGCEQTAEGPWIGFICGTCASAELKQAVVAIHIASSFFWKFFTLILG